MWQAAEGCQRQAPSRSACSIRSRWVRLRHAVCRGRTGYGSCPMGVVPDPDVAALLRRARGESGMAILERAEGQAAGATPPSRSTSAVSRGVSEHALMVRSSEVPVGVMFRLGMGGTMPAQRCPPGVVVPHRSCRATARRLARRARRKTR